MRKLRFTAGGGGEVGCHSPEGTQLASGRAETPSRMDNSRGCILAPKGKCEERVFLEAYRYGNASWGNKYDFELGHEGSKTSTCMEPR